VREGSLADLHCRAQDLALSYIEGIADDQWDAATPCSEWNVRALVNHLVANNRWVVELAEGKTIAEVGDALDGDVLGEDPIESFRRSVGPACEAFAEQDAMSQTFHLSFGEVPGSLYASERFVDVLIHAWDVATATGQAATLNDDLVGRCHDMVESQREVIRRGDAFGPEIPVDDDAATQVRLLALLGRRA
jgi:uncharacterized protein (TIGR03086 family)